MAKRRRRNGDEDFDAKMTPIVDPTMTPILNSTSSINVLSQEYETLIASGRLGSRSNVIPAPDPNIPSIHESNIPLPGSDTHIADINYLEPHDSNIYSEQVAFAGELPDPHASVPGPRKRTRGDYPLREWLLDRESFLSEFLRLEGQGDNSRVCAQCHLPNLTARYRCEDCDGCDMFCKECIISLHQRSGLHRLQVWDNDGGYFKKVLLKTLGHRFQLGHPIGERCLSPAPCHGFLVLDLNGVHEVALDFCDCEHRQPQFIQLLRFGWFPATVGFPHTASTLRLLKFFQMLSFESKASTYEFYQTLSRLTDNTGTSIPRDRYRTLLRMIREYRHIKMLKRAGRGHDAGGAAGTKRGECAVICPACPQPGINLPEGWESAPANMRFLYTLFLAIDANFRLKRKMISSHASDPSLSHGWSYFVEENDFKGFLGEYGPMIVQEPSTCSNHNAVNKNNGEAGFAATGAGCVDDARHDMKRPCAVGDLQKGERYINMDYLFCSTLRENNLVEVVVSYDIACQWSIHLWERLQKYPGWMHVNPNGNKTFRYLVPKFHLPAHVKKCQTRYSFNYNQNVGRTEGEGVERGWSHINPVATSTREMGPGSRRDTLDDHFGDWNWAKTTKMGSYIVRSINEAVPEMAEHTQNHLLFSSSLPSDDVARWTKELSDWEEDHSKENPYEARSKAMSQDAVRRKLAESEEQELQSGTGFMMHESTSASQLITMGLSLENEQQVFDIYLLRRDIQSLGTHATDNQQAKLTLQSNALFRKIKSWIQIQQLYIPALAIIRARESQNAEAEPKPQDIPLYLPSTILRRNPCDLRLRNIEWELRKSQCIDALDDLRESLRLKSHIIIYKSKNWRGQQANTRAQKIISRNQTNTDKAAYTYRLARDALARLAPILEFVGWEAQFPRLRDEDIRTLEADSQQTRKEMKKGKKGKGGEGRRRLPWIWTQSGVGGDMTEDERLHESLRIEWCKGKARQDRWREEVQLLLEEKRRIQESFEWRARDWERKATGDGEWMLPGVAKDNASIEGRRAYAREQADQFRRMQSHCIGLWKDIDSFVANGGKDGALVSQVSHVDDDDADDDDYIPPPLHHEDD